MKSRALKVPRWVLLISIGLCIAGAFVFVSHHIRSFALVLTTSKPTEAEVNEEIRGILNACGLGEDRLEAVLEKHVSDRSMTGDHLDAYAIRISRLDLEELTTKKSGIEGRWFRGDELPKAADDAVSFVGDLNQTIPWFPSQQALRTKDFYVFPGSVLYQDNVLTSVEVIFIRPSDKTVFYFDRRT